MNLSSNRINANTPSKATMAARSNTKTIGGLSSYGSNTPVKSLTEGQIIKGEVTDLRNNEIVVTLEDNTSVAAHLENGTWLAIGETAAFKVSSISIDGITLEALPKKDMTLASSTIQKALEEAGLPNNEKNQSIVFELMQNKLPINKQSIVAILQQSFLNKDIQISTLVLLHKHNIPITKENALQFENYRTGNHQLVTALSDLTANLPRLLARLTASNANIDASALTQQILSIVLTGKEIQASTPLDTTALFSAPEEQQELIDILENFDLSEDLKKQISTGTASLRQLVKTIETSIQTALSLDAKNLQEAGIEGSLELDAQGKLILKRPLPNMEEEVLQHTDIASPNHNVDNQIAFHTTTEEAYEILSPHNLLDRTTQKPLDILLRTDTFERPVIQHLQEQFHALQQSNHELGSLLSFHERNELSQLLKSFPIHDALKENIFFGDTTTTELLHVLKNVLPFTDKAGVQQLLQSPSFQTILKEECSSSFLLTPKMLKEPGQIDIYYRKLQQQLTDLEDLLKTTLTSKEKNALFPITNTLGQLEQQQISQVKDNLDFMKVLNKMFTYIQLPMKLKEETAHGDLYVYTKKKNLMNHPKKLRVLLHLDLTHLGSMDIHIDLNEQKLDTKFYFTKEDAKKLIETNIGLLETTLLEKGYLPTSHFFKKEQNIDIVKDFIEQDTPNTTLKRYSFDIRA